MVQGSREFFWGWGFWGLRIKGLRPVVWDLCIRILPARSSTGTGV